MNQTILALLIALRAVESTNGLDAAAHGNEYQITKRCVVDVNRIYHTRYHWPDDCRDRETAEEIVLLYLTHYGWQYYRDYGRLPSAEVLAKIYHCGYKGFRRGDSRGNVYWKKVKSLKKGNSNGRTH